MSDTCHVRCISVTDIIEDSLKRSMAIHPKENLPDGMIRTPERIYNSWRELFSGYVWDDEAIKNMMTIFYESNCEEMIVIDNIEFYSTCEHHAMPFFGKAHVAYIPFGGVIVGASKIPRLVDVFARRYQTQERLGNQVADTMMKVLKPLGAAVVLEAKHLCMTARGVKKQHSVMTTQAIRGSFKKSSGAVLEFMSVIERKRSG